MQDYGQENLGDNATRLYSSELEKSIQDLVVQMKLLNNKVEVLIEILATQKYEPVSKM